MKSNSHGLSKEQLTESLNNVEHQFIEGSYYDISIVAERLSLKTNYVYQKLRDLDVLDENNKLTKFSIYNRLASDKTYFLVKSNICGYKPRLSVKGIRHLLLVLKDE